MNEQKADDEGDDTPENQILPRYPPFRSTELSYERNLELIDVAKGITKTIYSEDTAATEKITFRK